MGGGEGAVVVPKAFKYITISEQFEDKTNND